MATEKTSKTDFCKLNITVATPELATPCLICGEPVTTTFYDRLPKICEKCKAAVMKVREQDGN